MCIVVVDESKLCEGLAPGARYYREREGDMCVCLCKCVFM